MNDFVKVEAGADPGEASRKQGMNAQEAAYMRGPVEPVAGSVPKSTSKYLNSPLYVHAFSTMSLRRLGTDIPTTYDIPDMSRALADVTDYAEGNRLIAEERKTNAMFAAWMEKRALITFDIAMLSTYAPGTLGATIHDFIVRSGMEIEFAHKIEPRSDLDYYVRRNGQSHDLQHMLTGFHANIAGEHALALMNITANYKHLSPKLAGFMSMPQTFVSSAAYTRALLHYDDGVPLMLEATRRGIQEGERIRQPLFMVDWEAYFGWQLDDIAADLGFERGPGEAWEPSDRSLAG